MDKAKLETPLYNLKRRAERGDELVLPAMFGEVIRVNEVIAATERLMANKNINTVAVLRDGAHRSSMTMTAGTTVHTLYVNGSDAEATSVPINRDGMVITRRKPERQEDRFLGFNKGSWLNLNRVGIDG